MIWNPADGLILEPNALRAAKEIEHCLVLTAGPGAGKTEMLAQRADFLLRTGNCRYPKRILAISFKVDASKNLKERVQRRCGKNLAARFDSYTFHGFAKRVIDRFRPLLTGDDSLDAGYKIGDKKIDRKQIGFGDLVPLATKILKISPVARNAIRQAYSDVFLDEFQDCTSQQYEFVKVAFQDTNLRVTAVGDTKQKIMGWAGALDGIFEKFVIDFSAIPLNMYRNFRSKPRLLRMQNEIIRVLDPSSVMPEVPVVDNDGEIYTQHFQNSQQEAEYLADLIANWITEEQIPLHEIAVLVSKQLDLYAEQLMSALQIKGIPFRNEQQMQDITTEPIARLIVDYLSCIYGQREPSAWLRLEKQLISFTDDYSQSSIQRNFLSFIKQERTKIVNAAVTGMPFSGWVESVNEFLKMVGIQTLVTLSPDYESRERLKEVVKETRKFIEDQLEVEDNLLKALELFSDNNAVRIMTIHKSKGLEFDSVIIMAVEKEIFFGNQAENRCAYFVGVSRAKRRLVLTSASTREKPANYNGLWSRDRTAQKEYFDYAL